jgi:hypothetical protein
MKFFFLSISFLLFIVSCNNGKTKPNNKPNVNVYDSLVNKKKQMVNPNKNVGFDTTGLSNAPIKIESFSLSESVVDTFDEKNDNLNHDGHFKRFVRIKLKYKNVSSKRIIGYQIKWYLVDSLGNPSDLKGSIDCEQGVGMGVAGTLSGHNFMVKEAEIKIGESKTDAWQQPCKNGIKILLVAPTQIEFYDQTRWNLGR